MCEECISEYPDNPLEATTIIDCRHLCDVHADEEINGSFYNEIDKRYAYIDDGD
jgi:hypothetical protein